MHLIWENLILNLILFRSGNYKGMDEGQPYVLDPHIWQVVGATSTEATKTIPSCLVRPYLTQQMIVHISHL